MAQYYTQGKVPYLVSLTYQCHYVSQHVTSAHEIQTSLETKKQKHTYNQIHKETDN